MSILAWILCLLAILAATPGYAEDYGDWRLTTTDRGAVTFMRHAWFVNEGTVGFICDKRPRGIGVSIIPPTTLYVNQQKRVTVVAAHGDNNARLTQDWGNGFQYIFQNDPDAVSALVSWLKTAATGTDENVDFMFSADGDDQGLRVLLVQARLKGFVEGYDEFARQCAKL
jgi:hypothetical protein